MLKILIAVDDRELRTEKQALRLPFIASFSWTQWYHHFDKSGKMLHN